MSKIKGQNFRLLLSSAVIPDATNASITMTANTSDVTTKDTEGLSVDEEVVTTDWSAQVDNFQSTVAQLQAIITMFNAAQPVAVGWDQTTGDGNDTPASASFARSGNAILNDFTFNFNDREIVSTSLQFQGTGALS